MPQGVNMNLCFNQEMSLLLSLSQSAKYRLLRIGEEIRVARRAKDEMKISSLKADRKQTDQLYSEIRLAIDRNHVDPGYVQGLAQKYRDQ